MSRPPRQSGLEPLGPSDVHVWFCLTETVTDQGLSDALDILSPDERVRHERFRLSWDRRDFALAHALLRTSLSRYGEQPPASWRFTTTSQGKPILDPPSFGFNLSHTKGLVACAVAIGGDVGVDVERVDRTREIDSSWASHFSRSEVEQLAACPPDVRRDRFFDTWTLKEAYGKAIGLGLGSPLDSTTFDLASPGTIGFTHFSGEAGRGQSKNPGDEQAQWRFQIFSPAPGFRLALAIRSSVTPQIVAREWIAG
jgi:4'-phosphopantetheinyl transferase